MSRMPIQKIVEDTDTQLIPDDPSPVRELYTERLIPVKLTIQATDAAAIDLFNSLPDDLLPTLPYGYQWSVPAIGGTRFVLATEDTKKHKLEVVVYGPDRGKINYLFLVDDELWQSFAHTKNGHGPERVFPMTDKQFRVPKFNYDDAKSHIRGHCIDHQDTMLVGGKEFYSTYDARNYIPEPHYKYWGLSMRRLIAAEQRKKGGAYMQLVHYPDKPYVTANKTLVPGYLYFYTVDVDSTQAYSNRYRVDGVYNIDWNINYGAKIQAKKKSTPKLSVLDFSANYTSDPESAPIVKLYDISASDRALRLQVRNLNKKSSQIISGDIRSLYKGRDALFAKTSTAVKEFESSRHKISVAISASDEKEAQLSKESLAQAASHGKKLLDLDDKREIIDEDQIEEMRKRFKSKLFVGFSDPDDLQRDLFDQIYKDQRSPTKGSMK